ncbi:unnamed protein product [Symbiodinium sp. KB8]|nr:unnamed protein product [Symbiodinium sp. KB8]
MLIAYAVPGSKSLQVQRADRDEALTLGFPLPDREGVGKAVQHQSSTHQTSQHNNSLHTQVPQNDDLIATSSQGLQGSSGETQGFQDDGDVSEGASRVFVGEVVDVPDGEAPVTDHPEGSSLTEPSADADLFDLVAYQQALEVLKKKCHAGCYDKDCEACVRARGAIRPHRSVSDGSKSYANLSLDISGPHVVSADKMKYIVIGVYRLPNGKNLYYAEPTKTKHASTVAEATVRIMAQLASLQVPPFFRLHTDCGKEFEAQLFKELGTRFSTFHTQSAPYNPQSNGRVERGVQALKQAAIRELVHSGLSPTYWTYAVQNAALYSRMRAMGIPVPKGTPKMGDWVAIKRPDAGDFEERANCGVFIGHNVSSVHGSWILCMVNGGLKMIRARLPVLLHQPAVRWKVSVDPDGDRRVWVSSNGQVVWGQDAPSGILTVEERLHGPEGNSGNLERIIKQRTWPRAAQESLELFTTFGHSILGAETLPEDIGPDPDSVEPETIVVDKLLADTAQANVIAAQPTAEEGKSGKYHIATFQEEQHAIEEEMQAILSGLDQASGITMTNDVFKTGTEAEIQKWVDAAKEELNNMDKLQVWTPSSWSTLRQDLGLKDTDEIPEIIPSKLVNVRKPVVMEEDIKKNAESAKQHAELNSWKDDEHGVMVFEPIPACKGLWKILERDTGVSSYKAFYDTRTLPPEPRDEEYQKRVKQGQSEVGSLMWVGLRSRPDIMSTVGAAACLLVNNPTETLRLTKGLWRFLRHTVNRCMQYKPLKANNDVHIHTDASYANGGSRPFKSILHGDNSGAITLSTRETFSELVVHTGTNEIKGDILTKSLSYRKLESACELLGLGTWSQE